MTATKFKHTPILKHDVAVLLSLKPGMVIVDGTLGGGGHAEAILEEIIPNGLLIGIDRDPEAIEATNIRLKRFGKNFIAVRGNYNDIEKILYEKGIHNVDGVLLDLGVSSHQLDTVERGFSYRYDAKLDMRMDPDDKLTAKTIVNEYSESELARVIYRYGEEKFSRRIASRIVQARKNKEIETTFELVELIKDGIPAAARRKGGHPAKRTFQALRVEVNGEIEDLEETVRNIIELLNDKGHLCVIAFHSLEDRAIKHTMRELENPCTCPSEIPYCICGEKSKGKVITKKPIRAKAEELEENPRSSSAKLRCFERIILEE